MNPTLLKYSHLIKILTVVFLATVSFLYTFHLSSIGLSGQEIARDALAVFSDQDKTIEYTKITSDGGIFESWHDPQSDLWRSETKDSQGNVLNITIVKGETVVQIAPKEKKASITKLSAEIVQENQSLKNKKIFDSIRQTLNSSGWNRQSDQVTAGVKAFVIERLDSTLIEKIVDGKPTKAPGYIKIFINQSTLFPVREERYEVGPTGRVLVESNNREYGLVSSFEGSSLFSTELPEGFSVQEVNQPDARQK